MHVSYLTNHLEQQSKNKEVGYSTRVVIRAALTRLDSKAGSLFDSVAIRAAPTRLDSKAGSLKYQLWMFDQTELDSNQSLP